MATSHRLILLTDVPTRYRIFTYEQMSRLLLTAGISLEVWFMAMGHPLRADRFREEDLQFPHRYARGIHPFVGGIVWHLSPGLLHGLRERDIDAVIVGGWASPNHLLAPFLVRPGVVKLLWTEGNTDSMRRTRGIAPYVKRRLVDAYDGYIVPQTRSEELILELSPAARTRPFLRFPNLIDGSVFRDGVARARGHRDHVREAYGIAPAVQLWLCPARLSPEKGLLEFLPILEGRRDVVLIVAGDGPQRHALEALVRDRNLPVLLVGNKRQPEMVDLYAAADLFVLPSLWDSSPLSAIEACAAGLPLLVSTRIGNREDVLEPGRNGWAFEPGDALALRPVVDAIAGTSRARLAEMGDASRHRYDDRFDTEACIRALAAGLAGLLASHHPTGRGR